MSIDAVFAQFFDNIHDPRQHAKIYYPFYDVLFLTVCAVIGGAEGWEDIEDFGEVHLPWFQSKGLFKNGIPVHDTIARIISGIKPEPFQAAFVRWTQAINQHTDGALVAIDGKTCAVPMTVRIERRPFTWSVPITAANKLVLGQIKPTPSPMKLPLFPSCWRCSTSKAAWYPSMRWGARPRSPRPSFSKVAITYWPSKATNPSCSRRFDRPSPAGGHPLCAETMTLEKAHGRIDGREYHVMAAGELAAQFPHWKQLHSIGVAISYRVENMQKLP